MEVHREPYLISIVCEVAKIDSGEVHRGIVFKVLRNINRSAVIMMLGHKQQGDNWQLVREPELYMNGPFEGFENRIKELFNGAPIYTEASFEIKYDTFTNQVRREYFLEKGFTDDNIPWAGLARHFTSGAPVTRQQWKEEFGIDPRGHTGFAEQAYRDGGHTDMDDDNVLHSPEQLKQAEIEADILSSKLNVK